MFMGPNSLVELEDAAVCGLVGDAAHPEVYDLDMVVGVNEKVGGHYIPVHDAAKVEVSDPREHLEGDVREELLVGYAVTLKGRRISVVPKDVLHISVVVVHNQFERVMKLHFT